MTQGKDIIYVNGDSFTEGCDLADHLYPFFKQYYSLQEITSADSDIIRANQISALDQKYNFNKHINDKLLAKEIAQFEVNNRWSNKLSEQLGKPVHNLSSHGGSSMCAIIHRTLADLHRLQKQGYNITDILIQVTSPSRYSFFKETHDREEPQRYNGNDYYYHIKSINPISDADVIDDLNNNEHYEMSVYRWLYNMYMFKHAIASITSARLILVDSACYPNSIFGKKPFELLHPDWLTKNKDDYLLDFKKQLDDEIKLSMLDCIDLNEPATVTAGLHFTAKIHDRFAKKISERYF
jgi:hypothetical protein